LSYFPHI